MFLQEIEEIPKEDRVYLDESGIEESLFREHGRSLRGERVWGEISGKSRQRVSVLAAWNGGGIKAPLSFEGYTDTDVFNFWIEDCLIPELRAGQTVFLDNASFHRSPKTKILIEGAGCRLKYLPTYSPDLNPIENQWAILKARIKKHRHINQTLQESINHVFQSYY